MKIVQINCVYNTGSTGKLVHALHSALPARGVDSVVIFGRGGNADDEKVHRVCGDFFGKINNVASRVSGVMYGGCYFSTARVIRYIRDEKPDIVHLHCINGYFVNIYRLVQWLKENRIKTVLTLHAEFMYTANCAYALDCEKWMSGCGKCPRLRRETGSLLFDKTATSWRRMKSAFDGFDGDLSVVSVSPWLLERAARSTVLGGKKHVCVLNGLDTEVFKYTDAHDLREKYAPNGEKIVFHATQMFSDDPDHLKGGIHLIRLAKEPEYGKVKFIVAGKTDIKGELPDNIILLGNIEDQRTLARFYSASDLTLLVSKKETFSMITAESLCCGTPVVGYRAGAPEQIALPEYSAFVSQGDLEALKCAVTKALENEYDKSEIMYAAHEKYSLEAMVCAYMEVYLGMK